MVGERGLLWAPEAEADLISIWGYGAEEWSEEVADAGSLRAPVPV